MNYEDMSDLQINLLVANAIVVDAAENSGVVFGAVKHEGDNVVSVIGVVDYCNNPSDAWPIIVSMISGGCVVQMLQAGVIVTLQGGGRIQAMDKNTLRAAIIVFLMMQEASQ